MLDRACRTAWSRAIGGCIVLGIAASAPAGAQTQQQIDWCVNKGNVFQPDLAIGGCTAAIQSGRWSGKGLASAFNNRGVAYRAKGDYDRAIADYGQAIRLEPNYADTFNNRCWTRALAGRDLTQALDDCNESLRLSPDRPHVLNSRGLVQLKLGAFDRAIADYGAALRHDPKDADSLYGRGIAKLRSGDKTGGEADIAAAKAITVSIAEIYADYGIK